MKDNCYGKEMFNEKWKKHPNILIASRKKMAHGFKRLESQNSHNDSANNVKIQIT